MARFNRIVTNRVMGLWAPYLPPWAVIVHRGRRSGREYRTVVWAWIRRPTVVVALTYGPTDWQRNVAAAGKGQMIRRGRTWTLTNPRVVTADESRTLPWGTRWTARVFGSAFVAELNTGG
ncbi:nitroreductase family deazaflavin-dependent oxidoreductase [Actinobacteria bacterium YIM 96077]|uniref:Nitroreductase family deazaflavin-dependent oxidoreductase n=2 Tax=Phytoactinopolyspora halophila TaxID=1981511 RepID=A0A329QXH8_9ACTN|nr:nitroreductase family deazaflavin-dependent oxidoreductase [Actinobacteria bacterium YIM 96077]RAW16419.1 nitroreductase family deazaflavin-dependent oxidoreductase [Phytoactinopolyspora halophila]